MPKQNNKTLHFRVCFSFPIKLEESLSILFTSLSIIFNDYISLPKNLFINEILNDCLFIKICCSFGFKSGKSSKTLYKSKHFIIISFQICSIQRLQQTTNSNMEQINFYHLSYISVCHCPILVCQPKSSKVSMGGFFRCQNFLRKNLLLFPQISASFILIIFPI